MASNAAAEGPASTATFAFGAKDIGAKDVALKFFGDELAPKLAQVAGRGKGYNWRKILEPVDAVEQCERVLSDASKTADCYLCGHPVWHKSVFANQYANPLYPECEHILPVTSARWYLNLYMNKQQLKDESVKEMLMLEYAWAHRICNQTKSNDLFIVENDDADRSISVNNTAIKQTLKNIQAAAKKHVALFEPIPDTIQLNGVSQSTILAAIRDMDIDTRTTVVSESKVAPIVNHVNNVQRGSPSLLTLARATCIYFDLDSMPDKLKEIALTFYTTNKKKIEDAVDETKPEHVSMLIADYIPDWLCDSLPDYKDKEEGLRKLLAPFVATNLKTTSKIRTLANNALTTTLPMLKERIKLAREALGQTPPDILQFLSYFHHELYVALWNAIYPEIRSFSNNVCFLRDLIIVLRDNASGGPPFEFTEASPSLETKEIVTDCDKLGTKRKENETNAIRVLDNLTTRQYERYVLEEDRREPLTLEKEVAYALVNFSQGMLPPEEFLENDKTLRPKIAEVERLRIHLAEIESRLSHPDMAKFPDRKEKLEAKKVYRTTQRTTLIKELCETIPKQIDSADDTTKSLYNAFVARYCGDTGTSTPAWIEWESKMVGPPSTAPSSCSSSPSAPAPAPAPAPEPEPKPEPAPPSTATGQGRRRTKRAKLSRHTKRVRRSGPSTKLRKRSFRKSQKGKLTKRSRY